MRIRVAAVLAALVLGGCAMEQYHFPQTMDKVPVPVLVTFGSTYPNDEIVEISEYKNFDGAVGYTITSKGKDGKIHTTKVSADGKTVEKVKLL